MLPCHTHTHNTHTNAVMIIDCCVLVELLYNTVVVPPISPQWPNIGVVCSSSSSYVIWNIKKFTMWVQSLRIFYANWCGWHEWILVFRQQELFLRSLRTEYARLSVCSRVQYCCASTGAITLIDRHRQKLRSALELRGSSRLKDAPMNKQADNRSALTYLHVIKYFISSSLCVAGVSWLVAQMQLGTDTKKKRRKKTINVNCCMRFDHHNFRECCLPWNEQHPEPSHASCNRTRLPSVTFFHTFIYYYVCYSCFIVYKKYWWCKYAANHSCIDAVDVVATGAHFPLILRYHAILHNTRWEWHTQWTFCKTRERARARSRKCRCFLIFVMPNPIDPTGIKWKAMVVMTTTMKISIREAKVHRRKKLRPHTTHTVSALKTAV